MSGATVKITATSQKKWGFLGRACTMKREIRGQKGPPQNRVQSQKSKVEGLFGDGFEFQVWSLGSRTYLIDSDSTTQDRARQAGCAENSRFQMSNSNQRENHFGFWTLDWFLRTFLELT